MATPTLFHVSEKPDILLFEPRPAPSPDAGVEGDVVWAIDEAHLPNYLLPRDCPRVTFAASSKTTQEDSATFFRGSKARRIVAVEARWYSRIADCSLYLYEFPVEGFELVDTSAGYFVSRTAVKPRSVTKLGDLLTELSFRHVEVRLLPELWSLKEAVAASSLEFSIIRFRNAELPLGLRARP